MRIGPTATPCRVKRIACAFCSPPRRALVTCVRFFRTFMLYDSAATRFVSHPLRVRARFCRRSDFRTLHLIARMTNNRRRTGRACGLSDVEIVKADVRELFAGLNPKAVLPKMRETIRAWRPDLIVRESAEFAAAIAADEAGIPRARGGALLLC